MAASLVESPQYSLFTIPGCHFTEVGLDIEPGMKFEHWERLLRCLERAEQGIQWYIGDALNYGEREYGERYAQVIDAHEKTGIPIDRLRQYQWVADRVKPVTRVTTLEWSVHREVASLPESKQAEILQRGAEQKAAGRKYTQRHAERDADKAKREDKPKPVETDYVLSKEARAFLDDYMDELARIEETIPAGCPSLWIMAHKHGKDALWQRGRTIQTDCKAITEMFSGSEGTEGVERAPGTDIAAWLEKVGYCIGDDDLIERLEYMVEKRMLDVKSVEESRQDGRRGVMVDLYALNAEYAAMLED